MLITAGGRITCQQCSARSKRTKQQCRAPAMKGKKVCRIHGGLSRGPVTEAGRLRCAAAKTKHGLDTRQRRAEVSAGLFYLHVLHTIDAGSLRYTRLPSTSPVNASIPYSRKLESWQMIASPCQPLTLMTN